MKQDRFLIGILVFIGLLVVAALVLFLVRNRVPAYEAEDTPGGVLYDYALALQQNNYERAYSYLAEEDGKPAYPAFRQAFLTQQLDPSTSTLQVGEVQTLENGEAWVSVTVQSAGTDIFDRGWSNSARATLVKQNGAWKISSMPSPYWSWEWYQPTPTPGK